jgi:uncharacterized protein (TIGR03435 family)
MRNGLCSLARFAAPAAAALAFAAAEPRPAAAQQADSAKTRPAFEVATVKPDDPGKVTMVEIRVYPGERLVIHGYTLHGLIAVAFDVPAWEVAGAAKWVDSTRFDIEGKPPDELRNSLPGGEFSNMGIQDAHVRSMLQALLIERFHLKFHVERQPGTVYLLKRSDGPLRLKPIELNLYTKSEDGAIAPSNAYPTGDVGLVSGVPVSIHQTSMPQLASVLSNLQHAPVSDETGLPGFYNFRSQTVVTDEDFKSGGTMHLLVEAVPEMGLKLVKAQGTVERFVIDSAEPPTAN